MMETPPFLPSRPQDSASLQRNLRGARRNNYISHNPLSASREVKRDLAWIGRDTFGCCGLFRSLPSGVVAVLVVPAKIMHEGGKPSSSRRSEQHPADPGCRTSFYLEIKDEAFG
ncbi:unnamed protein product [Caretta caretta]